MAAYKEKTFVSAVVYFRNNEHDAAGFIKAIGGQLDAEFENYEIIAVDDRSTDGTIAAVTGAAEGLAGAVSIVGLSIPQGVQLATNAGVDLAIGDFVFEFESCLLDFEPSLIRAAYQAALDGNDVVSAVPDTKPKFSSKVFYGIYNKYSGTRYPLATDRFRLVSRRAINRVQAMSEIVTYRKAFYMGCGLRSTNISYTPSGGAWRLRQDVKQRQDLAVDSLILFTDVSYKLSLFMSILMMFVMVLGGVYALVVYLLGNPIEGWTTTVLFMALAFFGMFAILTIIIKYLSVLLDLVFKKQSYTIESVTKL